MSPVICVKLIKAIIIRVDLFQVVAEHTVSCAINAIVCLSGAIPLKPWPFSLNIQKCFCHTTPHVGPRKRFENTAFVMTCHGLRHIKLLKMRVHSTNGTNFLMQNCPCDMFSDSFDKTIMCRKSPNIWFSFCLFLNSVSLPYGFFILNLKEFGTWYTDFCWFDKILNTFSETKFVLSFFFTK